MATNARRTAKVTPMTENIAAVASLCPRRNSIDRDIFAALCRRSGCGKSCMILLWVRVPAYGHADWRGLIGIIGLAAVEQTLQGGEMMFAAGLALVGRRGGVLAQRMLYDRGRHALEL